VKEHLKELVTAASPRRKPGLMREYLQARILQALQDHGAFLAWVFHGGTALRFLHGLPRFSEDLDFSVREAAPPVRFEALAQKVRADLEAEAYAVDVKPAGAGPVRSSFLKFPGLPHELGLSPHRGEVLSIKIEVDENPPAGAGTETTLVRRHVLLNLLHHDRPTLLAGKLHAVLARPYAKGRDLYDLLWYLADPAWPPPNLGYLRNALAQTGWRGPDVTESGWRGVVSARIRELDWARIVEDVRPFLERPEEAEMLTREHLLRLAGGGPPAP
jgi:hypothetical protein